MATTFDSTQWTLLVETAYDRAVDFALRSVPTFRQLIDKRPVRQAMPGDTVTFTLHTDLTPITTALAEATDGNEITVSTPTRVSVSLSERGSYSNMTGYLKATAFTEPVMERAELMARQQADSIDLLVKATMDSTANKFSAIGTAGALQDSAGTAAITGLKLAHIHQAVVNLRRNNVVPTSGNDYVAYLNPNHGFDLRTEAGPNAWIAPHSYVDTTEFYAGEVGRVMGARIIETPRCTTETITPASTPFTTFPVYVQGRQALVEACAVEPHSVVGTVVDHYNRFFPLGWYGLLGHNLYRPESMIKLNATSGVTI